VPIIIGTYAVKPGCVDRVLEVLVEAGDASSKSLPGFVAANTYVNELDRKIVSYLQWSTDGSAGDVPQPDIVGAVLQEGLVEWAEQMIFEQHLGNQGPASPESDRRLADVGASSKRCEHWRTAP